MIFLSTYWERRVFVDKRKPILEMTSRRFPPRWQIVEHAEFFLVHDGNGQTVGWFYYRDKPEAARHTCVLEREEARQMAVNFARMPELLWRADNGHSARR